MKNEVKIALVAVVGIVILFFGMQFLKGLDFFSDSASYQMKFSNVSGLTASSPIYANGFKVGTVKRVDYNYANPSDISVAVDIDKEMQIPRGTSAEIVSDLMGNVQVNLVLADGRQGVLEKGGVIDGRINNGALGEMKDMVPAIQQMLPKLDSILASVNALLADPAVAASLHNVQTITADLTTSTRELNQLLAQVNKQVPALAGNANALLSTTNGTMADAGRLVNNANGLVTNVNRQVQAIDFQTTMDKVNRTLANMQQLSDKLNSNQGSLGLLMNDPSLYNNLNATMMSADSLLVDLREHPKRYVHFSLFGRKDK